MEHRCELWREAPEFEVCYAEYYTTDTSVNSVKIYYATYLILITGSGLPRSTLLAHASLTLVVPYLHDRIRSHALSHAWPDAPSLDRRRKAWDFLNTAETIHAFFGLINFVVFLMEGR